MTIKIRVGYELVYECPQPTPMLLMLNVHYTRASDMITADHLKTNPSIPVDMYRDIYGNWCTRVVAPTGVIRFSTDAIVADSGLPDAVVPDARQTPLDQLPHDTLTFLVGSRYCETDRLTSVAWELFKNAPTGWGRVKAICDFVHGHLTFGYGFARNTKTAWEAYQERTGVCRDFAHLAVAFCRCMNIPARYCAGYLGDIGVPVSPEPMDFSGWFEAYLDGKWHTFDARHNTPRIGRILIGRGRDAADVALSTSFGETKLMSFRVVTDEVNG